MKGKKRCHPRVEYDVAAGAILYCKEHHWYVRITGFPVPQVMNAEKKHLQHEARVAARQSGKTEEKSH